MDDDTNARDNLQEDKGPSSAGRIEKFLTGIKFLADPSHRRRTYQNHLFELVGGIRKKGWILRRPQAKKLAHHFGYFQSQIRGKTLEEARIMREACMLHISGNHASCGAWCTGKRATDAGIPYNNPPMFDLSKNTDRLTFEAAKEVFYSFTTNEKLLEMMQPFTTQGNESLNMRGAELAPKFKNYSRTKSLDYRVQMVIGHHNIGMFEFYTRVFKELGITVNKNLAEYLRNRESRKNWKKGYDANPKSKRRRKFKHEAKDKEELLRLAAQGPKVGTYQSGVAMKQNQGNDKKTPRKRKKASPCTCGGEKQHFYRSSQFCLFRKSKTAEENVTNEQDIADVAKLT